MAETVTSRIDIDVTTNADKAAMALNKLAGANDGVVVSIDKATRVRERNEAAVERLAKRYDMEYRALRQAEQAQKALDHARTAGLAGTTAYERALAGLEKQQTAIGRSTGAMISRLSEWNKETSSITARMSGLAGAANDNTKVIDAHAKTVGLARHEWINLSRQMQDVGVSLAGGQSPFMVLTQQGSQIADVFSSSGAGAGAALKSFGATALRFALNPITLIAAAAGVAGLAMWRWKEQTDALTISLNGLGRQSGLTVSQANRIAQAAAERSGISGASARGLAGQFLNAGVSGPNIGGAIDVTRGFSRGLGLDLEDAGKELAAALAEPARGAEELAKKYGLVSFTEREHIKQLAAVGDKSGATAKLLAILQEQIGKMQDPTTAFGRLWEGVIKRVSDKLDKMAQEIEGPKKFKDVFDPLRRAAENEKRAQESIAAERARDLGRLREDSALAVREIQARTFAEREAVAMERARTQVMRETSDAVRANIAAESERAKLIAEGNRKAEDRLRAARDEAGMIGKTPLEQARQRIMNDVRDFREQNLPNAATPMAEEFNTAGNAAAMLADALTQSAGRIGRLIPLSESGISGTGAASMLRQFEGFQPRAKFDVNAFRAGFGSDTITRENGAVERVLRDSVVTRADAERDLARRLRELDGIITRQIGQKAFDGLSPRARAALDSVAYNYGSLPKRIISAAKSGDDAAIGAGIRGLAGDNGGVNARRRNVEADFIVGPIANDNGLRSRVGQLSSEEQSLRLAGAERQFRIEPQEEFRKQIVASEEALKSRIATLGQDQHAVDEAAKRQELMNDAIRQTGNILPEQQAFIDQNAKAWANYQEHVREADEAQKRMIENLDLIRGSARDALGGIATDLAHGKRASDALNDSLSRIADRLIALAADRAIEGLFGKMGGTNLGGGGGFFNAIANFFGFAEGGIVGAPGGRMVNAPISAFVGAPHFASGGAVPVIAHAGELILNAAQQRNVSDAIGIARGGLSNGNRGEMKAAPVTVNLIGAPQGTKVKETTDSRGGRRIDVVFDERIASSLGSPQGAESLQGAFGVRRQVARR